ncbi:hypothetical protein HK098_005570 [Nowakowskiella sp. JEL0407]|nr:hypothetical protein HK098_005570 [Nowakowskiella sp. JEL0407]
MLHAYLAISSHFYIFTTYSLASLSFFHFLLVLSLYNYFLCVFSSPGIPNDDWSPADPSPFAETLGIPENRFLVRVQGSSQEPRICRVCNIVKPPRAHHCRYCNCCILKFDHHCPWINNCVGFENQPHFVRFLVFCSSLCITCVLYIAKRLATIMDLVTKSKVHPTPGVSDSEIIFIAINLLMLIPVCSIVVMLCYNQLYYLCENLTTVEEMHKKDSLIFRPDALSSSDIANFSKIPAQNNSLLSSHYTNISEFEDTIQNQSLSADASLNPQRKWSNVPQSYLIFRSYLRRYLPKSLAAPFKRPAQKRHSSYDLGSAIDNIRTVLGDSLWLWFVPNAESFANNYLLRGNGYQFLSIASSAGFGVENQAEVLEDEEEERERMASRAYYWRVSNWFKRKRSNEYMYLDVDDELVVVVGADWNYRVNGNSQSSGMDIGTFE